MLKNGEIVAFSADAKKQVEKRVNDMADASLRTLGMAVRRGGVLANYNGPSHAEHENFKEPGNFINYE